MNGLSEEGANIVFHRTNACDAEIFHQHSGNGGGKEGGQGRAEMNVLYAQRQQCQQYNDGLLFIPGDVVHYGQFVHVVQTEGVLERKGGHDQRIGVVHCPASRTRGSR